MGTYQLPHPARQLGAPGSLWRLAAATALVSALLVAERPALGGAGVPPGSGRAEVLSSATLAALPLGFEPNVGQVAAPVRFLAHGKGYTLFLTGNGMSMAIGGGKAASASRPQRPSVLSLTLLGANGAPKAEGLNTLRARSNYLIGANRRAWHTDVLQYGRVRYDGLYPGIALEFHGSQGRPEYDFIVAPGATSGVIRMRFSGMQALSLDQGGNLMLRLHDGGSFIVRAPVVYQQGSQGRIPVAARFVLLGHGAVGFAIGLYDRSRPLVIDPTLTYSSYLGGLRDDSAAAVAVDGQGNIYLTGQTASTDFPIFPLTGSVNPPPAVQQSNMDGTNAFVTKIAPLGNGASDIIYSTYLGGTGGDMGNAIAVDGSGDAFVAGTTFSADFPGATNSLIQGANGAAAGGGSNGFVAKLNPTGSAPLYATYLGGTTSNLGLVGDAAFGIALDSGANAYITGQTFSTDFPRVGAFQSINKAAPNGGNAFVTKINAAGTALVYSSFLGGTTLKADIGHAIVVDSGGNAYVTGEANSKDFPVMPTGPGGAFQQQNHASSAGTNAFVTKVNATGSALIYSTYLGGSDPNGNGDIGFGIALDSTGAAYVAGQASSADFPIFNAYQPTNKDAAAGGSNAFVTELNSAGTALLYSTFLGGSDPNQNGDAALAIAVDGTGAAYVTGFASSPDFPTTPNTPLAIPAGAAAARARLGAAGIVRGHPAAQRGHHLRPFAAVPNLNSNVFVTKLNPSGQTLAYSVLLGGTSTDAGTGVAIDAAGNADVVGFTASLNFPTRHPFQAANRGGLDAFVSQIGVALNPPNGVACSIVGSLYSSTARLTIAINAGAPTNTFRPVLVLVTNSSTISATPFGAKSVTCNLQSKPATVTITALVVIGRYLFKPGDLLSLVLTVGPPNGPPTTALVTVTRNGANVVPPFTVFSLPGRPFNLSTF